MFLVLMIISTRVKVNELISIGDDYPATTAVRRRLRTWQISNPRRTNPRNCPDNLLIVGYCIFITVR